MHFFVYVPLPARLSRRVAAIARRHHADLRSAPHITIVVPRTLARGRTEAELVQALRLAAARLPPFPITYAGLGYFGDREFVYVPVRRTRALVSCHESCVRAVRGMLERGRPDAFRRPHITLAGRLPPDEGDRAWRALKRKRFAGRFMCRELLIWRKPNDGARWRLAGRCPLTGRR